MQKMFRGLGLAVTVALFGSTQALNVGSPALARAAPFSSPSIARASEPSMVAMTGDTLAASLKMRCDTSGAGYAIYWCNVDGQLVVASDYVTDARKAMLAESGFTKSFAEESEPFALPVSGEGPVATCYKTGEPQFVGDVSTSSLKRKDLAMKYGIQQISWVPMEGGVMEFGTSKGPCTADWDTLPNCPTMPKAEIRKGFENLGASYCLFWQNKNMQYSVVAEYTSMARKEALKQSRGDDKTFASESKAFTLDAKGNGPVATAARTGEEVIISDVSTMKRSKIAKEFGIAKVHMVPVEGGVLEYGTPQQDYLSGDLMKASLKMRCDTSGAGYAMYWKESFGRLTIAGSYLTPARKKALIAAGAKQSFAEASYGVKLDADGDGPVATVYKTQEPVYYQDVATSNMKRKDLATECGIKSVCFVPVAGGVMEYGVSDGPGTADWSSIADARTAIMPKAEMKRAFENGATHMIFWKYDKVNNMYVAGASYLIQERVRALKAARGDDKSYTSVSIGMSFDADGEGPIAVTARSGKEMVINDVANSKMKRAELAQEFNIGNLHFVPCRDGVLEYGTGLTE